MLALLDTLLQVLSAGILVVIAFKGGRWAERLEGAIDRLAKADDRLAGRVEALERLHHTPQPGG